MKDQVHKALFSPAVLMLGQIHLILVRSANQMDGRRWVEVKKPGGFSSLELTDFGQEIGQDEIHWWVFKKEKDTHELSQKTEEILECADLLKEGSEKLKNNLPESYGALLATLQKFSEQHFREIDSLHRFVCWLETRDPLAPRILFTYRVWGSTRISDRLIKTLKAESTTSEQRLTRIAAEIVLGVRMDGERLYDVTHRELLYEMYDNMDPEQLAYLREINVPENRVLPRVAREIYAECASYFREIRESLRNILIDIDKFEQHRDLLHSDAFWREFIVKAAKTKKIETQIWDFKETLALWHVNKQPERRQAKVTFAEDVASLANARGGVLVLGVSDQRQIVGLASQPRELENRLKTARTVLTKHLEYDADIVAFQEVTIPVERAEKNCLVIIVAQSCRPVGVSDGQGRYTYPIRQETGIERLSSAELSARKKHVKADNHDFMRGLFQFTRDN